MGSIRIASEAEWHAAREQHIGGSEIASLFYLYLVDGQELVYHMFQEVPDGAICLGCLSPYKTGHRLWLEKAGRMRPDDLSENERVIAGQHLEPALAEWAKEKFELKIRKVRRYLTHNDIPGWGASLDYEMIGTGMPPVEFKNVDYIVFRDDWVSDGDEIVMPPLHINLQLQAQIGVTDADRGYIITCVAGNQLKKGEILRHEPTQEKIGEAIAAFWQSIKADFEPLHLADFEVVKKEFAEGNPDKMAPAKQIDERALDCARYARWKRHLDFTQDHVDMLKARIAAALGEATRGTAVNYRVTWPAIHREEKLVPASVQRELNYRGAFSVKEIDK